MKGTVQYYVEALQTNVMNRLVADDATSLQDTFDQLLEEINETDEKLHAIYKLNLMKAYSLVHDAMTFVEQDEMLV